MTEVSGNWDRWETGHPLGDMLLRFIRTQHPDPVPRKMVGAYLRGVNHQHTGEETTALLDRLVAGGWVRTFKQKPERGAPRQVYLATSPTPGQGTPGRVRVVSLADLDNGDDE